MFIIKSIIFSFLCSYWTYIHAKENAVYFDYQGDIPLRYIKLDKDVLKQSIELLMTTTKTMQQELTMLKQAIEKKSTSFAEEDEELNVLDVKCSNKRLPESCTEVKECKSDIYNIMIPTYSNRSIPVSCDLNTDNGGWTVIQRRQDGSVNFYRNWTDYVKGFGNLNGEFFIGLEKLHVLTTQQPQELYIQLEDFYGHKGYAKYTNFKIDSAENNYKLHVDGYSGNAGDALSYHNGQQFSTWDRDNDNRSFNCAKMFEGAWWYKSCFKSNLNGKYLKSRFSPIGKGIIWATFGHTSHSKYISRTTSGYYSYTIKFSQIMIRPRIE